MTREEFADWVNTHQRALLAKHNKERKSLSNQHYNKNKLVPFHGASWMQGAFAAYELLTKEGAK